MSKPKSWSALMKFIHRQEVKQRLKAAFRRKPRPARAIPPKDQP